MFNVFAHCVNVQFSSNRETNKKKTHLNVEWNNNNNNKSKTYRNISFQTVYVRWTFTLHIHSLANIIFPRVIPLYVCHYLLDAADASYTAKNISNISSLLLLKRYRDFIWYFQSLSLSPSLFLYISFYPQKTPTSFAFFVAEPTPKKKSAIILSFRYTYSISEMLY